jgi:hypothetical protein
MGLRHGVAVQFLDAGDAVTAGDGQSKLHQAPHD